MYSLRPKGIRSERRQYKKAEIEKLAVRPMPPCTARVPVLSLRFPRGLFKSYSRLKFPLLTRTSRMRHAEPLEPVA